MLGVLPSCEVEVWRRVRAAAGFARSNPDGSNALDLANGVTGAELRRLYEERGKLVFDDSWWDGLCGLGKARGAAYKTKNLETEVRRLPGNARLKDPNKRVLIPALDLDIESPEERCWAPKFFQNFPGEDRDGDELAFTHDGGSHEGKESPPVEPAVVTGGEGGIRTRGPG